MESTQVRPDLWSYDDFRKYLKDFINYRKRSSSRKSFSLEQFCREIQFVSRSHLSLILNGHRNLKTDKAIAICETIFKTRKEKDYFLRLVKYNQSKCLEEKLYYRQELCSPNVHSCFQGEEMEVLGDWKNIAVLEYFRVAKFSKAALDISKAFRKRLSVCDIRRSLNLLKIHELLKKSADGNWYPSKKNFNSRNEVKDLYVQKYHASVLRLALDMVTKEDIDKRNLQSACFFINKEELIELKKEIREYLEKLVETRSAPEQSSVLIQLNTQILEIT